MLYAAKEQLLAQVKLAAEASHAAAMLVAYILPVCALLAPCRLGGSTPRMAE